MNSTYGSAFVGLIVSATLYGATILQVYLYYRNYPKDARFLKVLVFTLCIFDTMQLVLCVTALYWYLITNYNNPSVLDQLTWSMELQTDCNGVIALLVECFFARRVWLMSSNMYLVTIIVILAAIHFVLGIVFTVDSFRLVTNTEFGNLIWVTSAGIGSAAAADVIIAGALCFYLSKSRTGFKKTDSLISTLIVYSLTTGLITSLIGVVIVVTFATMPNNYIWLAFFWIDGKCYVNSCLAALNSRESLREKASPQDGSFFQLSRVPGNSTRISSANSRKSGDGTRLAITVHTDTVFKTDYTDPLPSSELPVLEQKTESFPLRADNIP
ncbi:hypothetical protein DFH05DRAFT_802911 [Lentinula detonsa]|uniref:DUF6534 domain-containing protein n=1 Tax=Lentinula detonsa TaxID=2804962 RepID=A0A9W8P5E8_9AGAR|nr:hypothetical protein DFH05DRAFT_802911 [Lentinula detonsa]KAJ3800945.1 hypothetical protein GGU11DRAFT_327508 [Lentinula aff. detonsa]